MHISKLKLTDSKRVLSVYILFILFIALLLVMNSEGGESRLTSQDIDQMLQSKWTQSAIEPSKKTTDEEFIRRIYLDLTGRIPSAEEVSSFLNDSSPDKRKNKIDELLASEEYGEFMADIWLQILFPTETKRRVQAQTYKLVKDEFADNFKKNKPYTEFVKNLISAQGFATSNPYALYAGRFETPEDAAGHVMKTFAGRQIQCAQCHKHPYEKISQEDFYGVASFFARKQQ
jgi:hypothetical protein